MIDKKILLIDDDMAALAGQMSGGFEKNQESGQRRVTESVAESSSPEASPANRAKRV